MRATAKGREIYIIKFLEQEYPLEMVEQQFGRAMQLKRNDLINKKKNKNRNEKNRLQETLETHPFINGSKISFQPSIKMQQ